MNCNIFSSELDLIILTKDFLKDIKFGLLYISNIISYLSLVNLKM